MDETFDSSTSLYFSSLGVLVTGPASVPTRPVEEVGLFRNNGFGVYMRHSVVLSAADVLLERGLYGSNSSSATIGDPILGEGPVSILVRPVEEAGLICNSGFGVCVRRSVVLSAHDVLLERRLS